MRRRVAEFAKRITSEEQEDAVFRSILSVINGNDNALLSRWLDEMQLMFYPKSIVKEERDEHIVTNILDDVAKIKRVIVRCDIPVELLIIDVAWILEYGYTIDAQLDDKICYANRLELCDDKTKGVKKGNAFFKRYHKQYHRWWQNGLDIANKHLKEGDNISIITFDVRNCYHSVNIDFNVLREYISSLKENVDFNNEPLTKTVWKIYERYWELTSHSNVNIFSGELHGRHVLPLDLFSAQIIANWYLSSIDNYLLNTHTDRILYYGRYVDDCMLVTTTQSSSINNIIESIEEEIPGLFRRKEGDDAEVVFQFADNQNRGNLSIGDNNHLSELIIQKDKLYLYRFDCQLPQTSIEQIEEELKEKSSEFRFLTDDIDNRKSSLEFATLIEALDPARESGRRFNILENNSYKLSIFLSKLANRLVYYPEKQRLIDELEKVYKYFHDSMLIENYLLWERLLTIFVLGGRMEYVEDFRKKVNIAIEALQISEGLSEDPDNFKQLIKNSLHRHLDESLLMAQSLAPHNGINMIYHDTYMVRMHYNRYPLQEFLHDFVSRGAKLQTYNLNYDMERMDYRWMPYYIKFFDIACVLSLTRPQSKKIYENAYKIYLKLNKINDADNKSYLESFMYKTKHNGIDSVEFNTSLSDNICESPITVAIAEIDIKEDYAINAIQNFGTVITDKVYDMQKILDLVSTIRNADIFILPELALPIYELREYCQYAAKEQKAFVAGMEYVVTSDKKVYNFTLTCLPINMYGRKDAVPVIRTKHHYAPEEYKNILKPYKVGNQSPYWQYLYHWKGHIFTTYYCFELCDIIGRSHFRSFLDAMYAPVFNHDTYYFNNIAESWVRDLHAFMILSNVSHLGDSRISQPKSHVFTNIMKVKGGNTKDNRIVVLSGEIDIKALRKFQQFSKSELKKYNKEKEAGNAEKSKFKPLPPGFDKFIANSRSYKYFVLKEDQFDDNFFRWIYDIRKEF